MADRRPLVNVAGQLKEMPSGDKVPIAALASGTADGSKFVRDDGTLAAPATSVVRAARTSNTQLGSADRGGFIDASGTWTQTFAAVSTLGNGWWCWYRNSGTGTITLDPNGSETIDGVTSGPVTPGLALLIVCDGSALYAVRAPGGPSVFEVLTSGTSWTAPLGARRVKATGVGGGGGGNGSIGSGLLESGSAGATFVACVSVTPGTAYTYAIGAAGAGGSGGAGSGGGNTTLTIAGVTYTANGGTGGSSNNDSVLAGGTASNAALNLGGGASAILTATNGSLTLGGDSTHGRGGARSSGGAIVSATGYGAGGYGYANSGEAGRQGVLILEY